MNQGRIATTGVSPTYSSWVGILLARISARPYMNTVKASTAAMNQPAPLAVAWKWLPRSHPAAISAATCNRLTPMATAMLPSTISTWTSTAGLASLLAARNRVDMAVLLEVGPPCGRRWCIRRLGRLPPGECDQVSRPSRFAVLLRLVDGYSQCAGVTANGRAGLAGRAVRAEPPASAGRRLQHARHSQRGAGRGAGSVAAARPQRPGRHRRPARLADHRGRPDQPGHAARPQGPPRGVPRQLAARAAGGRFRRRRPRTPGGAGRLGRPGPACGAGYPQPRRTDRKSVV